mmetsp:Transcript_8481/g.26943  ORF Transcript_8481/g.26943 Transcript_8481/m.26943 type:complete len:646 (+) Transcript_8481:398-2335(+)
MGVQLAVYTNGIETYARQLVAGIDPTGKYFGDRVIYRPRLDSSEQKSLSTLIERFQIDPAKLIIVDDRLDVWDEPSKPMVVRIKPFFWFQEGTKKVLMMATRVKEISYPPSAEDTLRFDDNDNCHLLTFLGRLQNVLGLQAQSGSPFISEVLAQEKRKVLVGKVIAFSGVFHQGMDPSEQALWKEAERFGARCVNKMDETVTHLVIEGFNTTAKLKYAEAQNLHIVALAWLLESLNLWVALPESHFESAIVKFRQERGMWQSDENPGQPEPHRLLDTSRMFPSPVIGGDEAAAEDGGAPSKRDPLAASDATEPTCENRSGANQLSRVPQTNPSLRDENAGRSDALAFQDAAGSVVETAMSTVHDNEGSVVPLDSTSSMETVRESYPSPQLDDDVEDDVDSGPQSDLCSAAETKLAAEQSGKSSEAINDGSVRTKQGSAMPNEDAAGLRKVRQQSNGAPNTLAPSVSGNLAMACAQSDSHADARSEKCTDPSLLSAQTEASSLKPVSRAPLLAGVARGVNSFAPWLATSSSSSTGQQPVATRSPVGSGSNAQPVVIDLATDDEIGSSKQIEAPTLALMAPKRPKVQRVAKSDAVQLITEQDRRRIAATSTILGGRNLSSTKRPGPTAKLMDLAKRARGATMLHKKS